MHASEPLPPPEFATQVNADVAHALAEDIGSGDLTAGLIDPQRRCVAKVICREAAILCGRPWFDAVLLQLDASAQIDWKLAEGARCSPGTVVVEIRGNARALLSAERSALNFLQLLSAVATKTASYMDAVQGTQVQVVDTRKTLPGLRLAQKYAVRTGGGTNHRIGLFDAILIKENHIAAAGGLAQALAKAAEAAAQASFVQIEVETLAQLEEALALGARMVLLDNMDLPTIDAAVRINAAKGTQRAQLEISGGVTLSGIARLAQTGVDRISVGSLTKDVQATDFSMRFAPT